MVFLLFAINGPAINLIGQLRLSELAILVVGILNVMPVTSSIGKKEKRLGLLFILTAFVYVLMDAFNQGIESSTVSLFGTYIILSALLFSVRWIIDDSKARLIAALLGFSFSFVLVLVLNLPVPSAKYHLVPWRLGLGAAATLFLCTAIFYFPRHYVLGLLGLISLAVIHLFFNSRNLALITTVVFLVGLWAYVFGLRYPGKYDIVRTVRFLIYGAISIAALYGLINFLMSLSILPDEVQSKFETQQQNSYGLVVAARPDVATAIYGITQRPITGFGSSTVDPNIYEFYARVAAMNFLVGGNEEYQFILEQEPSQGTPSHSHIFGAWVDAGIFAAMGWMAVLALCGRVLSQVVRYRNAITPLAIFTAVSLLWDVLFSPGPVRIEVALSIVVLLFVDRHLELERHNTLLKQQRQKSTELQIYETT
jgi:hypothetical protein